MHSLPVNNVLKFQLGGAGRTLSDQHLLSILLQNNSLKHKRHSILGAIALHCERLAFIMSLALSISFLITLSLIPTTFAQAWTPMVIKNITVLGPQLTPDASNVSRDGGYSTLINGKIVWLYDDTECFDHDGNQLSFVSNTAAYSSDPNNNILTLKDFGVINLGTDSDGSPKTAILAGTTMGAGGWIPFQPDEIDYNKQMNGKERVAICTFSRVAGNSSRPLSIPD